MSFSGVDFYAVEELLSDDERAVRDLVREFVEGEVLPVIEGCAWEGRFPRELVPKMAALNLFGSTIPDYGLPGLNNVAYGLIMQELERGDSGLRSFVSVQSSLVMYPIHAYGSTEQKDRWIPALASGEAVGCFGLTEPDFGSNPSGLRTVARKEGARWVLNGAKAWITNGSIADVAVVWAKVGGPDGKIRGFLVPRGTPGFTTSEHRMKMSLRASVTSQLAFEECRIPEENVLPGVEGLKGPLSCLTQARYGISWGALGSAMATYHCALEYAKSRKQFRDRPIAAHQLVQAKLAFMITEITKGQLLALRLGRLKDAGRMKPEHVSMAKRNNVWVARECARLAREILGANGIVGEYPVFRHLANIESVYTYEGTHDIHTLVLGQAVTGIPAYDPPAE
ncbi:MAG TPA: acyl-CoA dehydrogenase family protein [Thermoanaerobaculia bacterium]|nr:acyl-CoA dehydrogenase family protein [Thermoanaerobaculia bacterium]HQR67044.1 acyl-CoA dehydrogenase family protein [Thermoanaerobaculia bacterium]